MRSSRGDIFAQLIHIASSRRILSQNNTMIFFSSSNGTSSFQRLFSPSNLPRTIDHRRAHSHCHFFRKRENSEARVRKSQKRTKLVQGTGKKWEETYKWTRGGLPKMKNGVSVLQFAVSCVNFFPQRRDISQWNRSNYRCKTQLTRNRSREEFPIALEKTCRTSKTFRANKENWARTRERDSLICKVWTN